MSEEDDLIREALIDYAFTNTDAAGWTAMRDRMQRDRRRTTILRVAAAAVVALIVGGVVLALVATRTTSLPPVEPTPRPSSSSTPAPSPRPSTTPSPDLAYPLQTRSPNGLTAGGVGDIINGIRLDGITFVSTQCPDADECPESATVTVTNTTPNEVDATILITIFRNNNEAVGDGPGVLLAPSETATVAIDFQPMLADNAPMTATGSIYSWNFAAIVD